MKIKLDQLKKIIREELAGELSENTSNNDGELANAIGEPDDGQIGDKAEEDNNDMSKLAEEEGSSDLAKAIADLETMHQNLEGIIDRLKEDPNAPLGTDVAMAHWGLDD